MRAATHIAVAVCLACLCQLIGAARADTSGEERLALLAAETDSLLEAGAYERLLQLAEQGLALADSTLDPQAPERTDWLLSVGWAHTKLGHLELAERLVREGLAAEMARDSAASVTQLRGHRYLRTLYVKRDSYEESEALAERCVELSQAVYGADDVETAGDLLVLARLRISRDRIEESQDLIDRAEALVREQLGDEDEFLADVLLVRSLLVDSLGKYDASLDCLERSLEIKERYRGERHPELVPTLGLLADLLLNRGELVEAEALLRRALSIQEAATGGHDLQTASLTNTLGVVLSHQGSPMASIETYRNALALYRSLLGESHPEVARTMINLSATLRSVGRDAEALELLRPAVEIMEASYGPESTQTAWAISHLAQMMRQRGNAREAERLFRRCLRIAEATFGSTHRDVALYYAGIAQCLRDQGELGPARKAFQDATDTAVELWGPDSHMTARYQRELGIVHLLLGELEQADAILTECAARFERQLGPHHPALNRCWAGLTLTYLAKGRIADAKWFADRNLEAAEIAFGEKGLRRTLLLKAAVGVALQSWDEAAAYGIRAAEIALATQEDIFQLCSEREVLLYAADRRRVIGTLLAVVQAAPQLADSALQKVFSLAAREHGQVVDRFAQRRQLLDLTEASPASEEVFAAYVEATQRLADLVVRGPQGDPKRHSAAVATARREKVEAERALAAASERFERHVAYTQQRSTISPDVLAAHFATPTTLVHFVRFPQLTAGTPEWRPGATTLEECIFEGAGERYGAFRLRARAGPAGDLEFVDLGRARDLDSLIVDYRRAIDAVGSLGRPSARHEAEYRTIAKRLYEAVWAPVMDPAPESDGPPIVLLVPSGGLHLLDFNTLLSPDGRLVIEQWKLHLLSSVRDLERLSVERPASSESRPEGLLIVGNPEIGSPPALCEDLRSTYADLPGAEMEIEEISRLFSQATGEAVDVLRGAEATEQAVKTRMTTRRMLHIAAHGFFCGEIAQGEGRDEGAVLLDPLLQCGLVLAADTEGGDGLLTAQEIVVQDLRKLDWVVLSACNSGLGRLVPGEGLFGLRRAFEIAGARTVLMALWRLEDATARDLMRRVYAYRLDGRSTLDAVREAQLDRMREARRRTRRVHPCLWAGIVAEGDWR